MNHNEIVGWKNPVKLLEGLQPVFLRDTGDHLRIQTRIDWTSRQLEKHSGHCIELHSEGHSWVERLWSLILLGDYTSVYLSFLNQENPSEIDVIDELKKLLSAV
jgi:glucose/mannose-6-phosphate isomerase